MSAEKQPVVQQPVPKDSSEIVDALLHHYEHGPAAMQHVNSYELPSTEAVTRIVSQTRALIFPGWVGSSLARTTRTELADLVRERVDEVKNALRQQLYRGLHHRVRAGEGRHSDDCPRCAVRAADIASAFLGRLVELRELIATDINAAYESDPAASGTDEIIFCYPGVYAISVYRIAHELLALGAEIIPRMMTESAHEKTGIDIHPGACIGQAFFIDHGTGVVIGETTVIGDRVRVYQGVTLGAHSPARGEPHQPARRRHPTIENDVVIYAGATILGGDTVIGRGSVIGGNCWVTSSVPAATTITQSVSQSERTQRELRS